MAIAQGQFTLTEVNDGSNGAGVVKIDNYYYASSSDTPVPSTANGKWKTNISNLTDKYGKDFPYLWNYEVTTLENDSPLSTSPELISHYGTDGRGIHEVKEYYLRSSSSSGINKPTSEPTSIPDSGISNNTWYSEPVATTSTYKYLWNCEKIVYTDETNGGYTTPAIIGTHGSTGDPGTVQGTKLFYSATASDITAPYVDLTSSKTSSDVEDGQIAFNTTTWYSEAKFFGVKNTTDSTKYGAWDIRQSADVCRPGHAPCVWKIELILSQADGKWYCAYSPQKVSLLEAATIAAQIQATGSEEKETNNLAFWCKKAGLSIIDGSTIVAGSIDADRLSVNSLSAINANLGTVKAGTIQSSNYNNVNEILICSSGLAFTLNSDGTTYSVSGIGSCDQTDIIIPATHNYLPVTSVAENAFWLNTSLTSVVIPGSVISIGKDAFDGCFKLESVVIPDSVTSIGDKAFYSCKGLSSVTIPNSVEDIGDYAFAFCDGLTYVDLPDGVISIGSSAFRECNKLTSIVIPDSVTSIGQYAFYKCSRLTSVAIGESLISIGDSVFANCTGLKNIILPNSVTNIVDYAFSKCNSLISVYYTGTIKDWSQIDIKTGNETLTNATIYYSSTTDEVPSSPSWYNMEKNRLKISLDNGTIDSKYFKLASDGTIRAENADISGKINATSGNFTGEIHSASGTIGGFYLDETGLFNKESTLSIRHDAIMIGKQGGSSCEISYDSASDTTLFVGTGKSTKFVCGDKTSNVYLELSSDVDSVSEYSFVVQAARYKGDYDGHKNYEFCYAYRLSMTGGTRPYPTYVTVTFDVYRRDLSSKRASIGKQFVIPAGSTCSKWYTHDSLHDPYGWLEDSRLQVIWSNGKSSDWFDLYDKTSAELNDSLSNITKTVVISSILSLKLTNGNSTGAVIFNTNCVPTSTKAEYNLGMQGQAWKDLFLSGSAYNSGGGPIDLSDANCKNSIAPLSDAYSQMFDSLKPIVYQYNKGTSNRLHTGFIAQDVKVAIESAGLTTQDFAAYCEWEDADGSTTCGLRYSELIALCVSEIQKLKKRVEELENNTK